MITIRVTHLAVPVLALAFAACGGASPASPTSPTVSTTTATPVGPFSLASPVGANDGMLPAEYTCDGGGSTIALSWANVPTGTQEFALLMTALPGDGTLGVGSDGPSAVYQPPCSQGPGAKVYTFTVYALSGPLRLSTPASQTTGAVVTSAIAPLTLGSASLSLSYTRPR